MEKETQAWVTEFQCTLTQLEHETEEALQVAREQVKKDAEAQLAGRKAAVDAERHGAIELSVAAPKLKGGYDVEIDGRRVKSDVTGKNCGIAAVVPGIHELTVTALADDGRSLHASRVVQVAPLAIVTTSVELT